MNAKHFCKNMKYYRELNQFSFVELSNRLAYYDIEVSAPTLQRYESGKIKTVPYQTIVLMAEIFGIEPPVLMGWDVTKSVNHRTTRIDERVNDFIQELNTRDTKFTIDGLELDKTDISMLQDMLQRNLTLLAYALKSKHAK